MRQSSLRRFLAPTLALRCAPTGNDGKPPTTTTTVTGGGIRGRLLNVAIKGSEYARNAQAQARANDAAAVGSMQFSEDETNVTRIAGGDIAVRNMPHKGSSPSASPDAGPSDIATTSSTPGSMDVYKRSTSDFVPPMDPSIGIGGGFGLTDRRFDAGHGQALKPQINEKENGDIEIVDPYSKEMHVKQAMVARDEMAKLYNSVKGTSVPLNEHYLLADLDFEKDSLLFGTDPEKFEENVNKLKTVITEYQEWEQYDDYYKYATWVLKAFCLYIFVENMREDQNKAVLAGSLDTFIDTVNDDIEALNKKREEDFAKAKEEFKLHPPDFAPILAAIEAEKKELAAARADSKALSQQLVTSHPLDTEKIDTIAKKTDAEEQRSLMGNLTMLGGATSVRSSSWFGFGGSGDTGKKRIGDSDVKLEDLQEFSYAASPTSVTTLRHVRRIVLPKSDDFAQIVREEMMDYRREKSARMRHPDQRVFPQ